MVYSFRYRSKLPESIQTTAPEGKEWIIVGVGSAQYCFKLCNVANIVPNPHLEDIPIPDNIPEAISLYQLSDEQSLLCKIRYNRLLDLFLGMVTYSMQNHLRTRVKGIGQIEIDELYVGVNKIGQHFIIPVEAKGGTDKVGVVQMMQDIRYCEQRFPDLICVPVAVHRMADDNCLCMFRLTLDGEDARIVDEKHYKLLLNDEIDAAKIAKTFTMPAADVTVGATFATNASKTNAITFYSDGATKSVEFTGAAAANEFDSASSAFNLVTIANLSESAKSGTVSLTFNKATSASDIMVKDADEDEIRAFLRKSLTYEIPEDQNDARAVLNVSSEANEYTFAKLRRDEDIGEALRRVMKDDLAESEQRGEQNAKVIDIKKVMEKLKYTVEQAMDFLDIPSDQRSMYAGMVNKK